MRAVIYARYSSDKQSDSSIEDQVRLCRTFIDRQGWAYLHAYNDRAASGATFLRLGYQRLLEDARADQFDVIVAEALDRISRDQEDVAGFYKRMTFANVKIITVAEGEITDLHVGLKGTMNALYLKDLSQKTRRGLEGRVRQGRSGGGLCYGYDVVRTAEPLSKTARGERRINPIEAAIVLRIFQEFTAGKSPRRIAFELNKEGVPGPRGGAWSPTTINGNVARGTGILNNELYIGRLVWNRLRYVKDPDNRKRNSRLNPKSEWVIQDVPQLGIVPEELWANVKTRQRQLTGTARSKAIRSAFWDRRRPRYLFSGLIKCGCCAGGYSKISHNLFGCSTARNKGTCSNRLNIRRDVLENTVIAGLKDRLMEPELFKAFAEEFYKEVNRLRMQDAANHEAKRQELDRVTHRLRKLVDAIADGVPARTLRDELARLEARQEELEGALLRQPRAQSLLHPNLAEIYRGKVAELHSSLRSDGTGAEATEIIRSLVDEIVLTPEDGRLRIDLKGELAGILALCEGSKKPATLSGNGLEQIKMVAGAGFEPATFRL